jgi:hypothetical protein
MLASVAGQKPRRPQFVRIASFAFRQRQRRQPYLGFDPAKVRAIVQRDHRTFGHSPLNAALNRLMMQSKRLDRREKRPVLRIAQQYPRPLDPTGRLGSRLRY